METRFQIDTVHGLKTVSKTIAFEVITRNLWKHLFPPEDVAVCKSMRFRRFRPLNDTVSMSVSIGNRIESDTATNETASL